MQNKTETKVRRRALLGAISTAGVVGAAKLPGQWTRPVVDHVLLPAHAETTDDSGASGTGASTFITTITSNCMVSCTSALRAEAQQTFPYSQSQGVVQVLITSYYSYTQCSDGFGGFTTAVISSDSSSFISLTHASDYFAMYTSSSFTSNAISNVTVTSS